jgi:PBP1b-binding outer membrane lipoprotein LpoB
MAEIKNRTSNFDLNERMAPENKYSPTRGQVEALYSVFCSEIIPAEVMEAVLSVPGSETEDIKPSMESWNKAVNMGMGDKLEEMEISVLSTAFCLSVRNESQEEFQLRRISLNQALRNRALEKMIDKAETFLSGNK